MLISSGHMFDVLEKGDSIRNPITNKYDIILANPPFGIDGLTYDDINHALRNEYLPIKSNSAVPLFLQAIIYQLKINGRCAVVLPEGQELFSKSNALVAVREFLMKTCDLKEVIYLPAGTFTHTSIKTCIFYFVKKREGKDTLETNIKISKITQKETGREYKFSKTHQTTKVYFYDYNPDNNVKHELIEGGVSIDELSKNNYSLNYAEYLKDTVEDEVYEEGIIVKKLGECCNFDIGGTPSRSKNEYYENGTNLWVSVRELNGGYIYNTKEKLTDLGVQKSSVKLFSKGTILFSFKLSIGKTAIVGNPLYSNEAIAGIISKNNTILDNKYLYYYLTNTDFTKKGSGMLGNGSLNKKSLAELKIPIPSLKKQKEIIEYCELNEKKIKELENEIKQKKIETNLFLLSIVKKIEIEQNVISDNELETNQNIEDEEVEVIEEVKPKKKASKNKTMIV
jgi:type I restriction enzyme M protein